MRPRSCSWMMATRSKRPPSVLAAAGLAAGVLLLTGCSPDAPPGVDKAVLDEAVSRAVGDPNTCVLIAARGGRTLYRYNTATTCAKRYPACDGGEEIAVADLLADVARDGQPRYRSCPTTADRSRGVGWAAGPVAGKDLVYAAVMEGDRAFPGRMMADRLEGAFRRAGVSAP